MPEHDPEVYQLALQMKRQGESLIQTGNARVKMGQELIELADRMSLENTISLINDALEKTPVKSNSLPSDIEITARYRTRKFRQISTGDAAEQVLRGLPGHRANKIDLFEAIKPLGPKCASIQALTSAISADKRFTSLGGGVWTLAELDLPNISKT